MGILEEKEEQKDIQLEISNILLDEKSLKFPMFKIIYDDCDIKIDSRFSLTESKEKDIKDLKNILSKKSDFKCSECNKKIISFEFFTKKGSKNIIICNDCYNKLKEKNQEDQYISLDKYISTCAKHEQNNKFYCIDCNKNICAKCKASHLELGSKHKIISLCDLLEIEDLEDKIKFCKKVKSLSQVYKSISEIRFMESKSKEAKRYKNISERFARENRFAEIIIATFFYFSTKKAICYEIISNFNEIIYNKSLKEIDIQSIFDSTNKILEPSFHIIQQSPDVIEIKKKIIPLSQRNKICSDKSLNSEIRGLMEIKGGYYLVGSMNGEIGIFEKTQLELKQTLRIEGITNIYHMEKIKHENLDLIAVASNLNDIILISVFQKEKEDEKIFDYKIEFKKEEHKGKINKIIQLSNGLVVSASEDLFVIFWKLIKNGNNISLESVSKIEMDIDVFELIEIPLTNELLCNNKLIDLETLCFKRKLNIYLEGKTFYCSACLFKEKYIGYVSGCDGISVINIETGKKYFITGRFDYVDAVYSIDNETFCLCTKDLHDIFGIFGGRGLSQQFKLDEDEFEEIGGITITGVCNCYMTDSDNNFIMGNMAGELLKFT